MMTRTLRKLRAAVKNRVTVCKAAQQPAPSKVREACEEIRALGRKGCGACSACYQIARDDLDDLEAKLDKALKDLEDARSLYKHERWNYAGACEDLAEIRRVVGAGEGSNVRSVTVAWNNAQKEIRAARADSK